MAMFSMFFGAGNVVFPLLVGQVTTDQSFWSMLGLCITAVGLPFTGLFAMTLYNGDYRQFFSRLGKWPGFATALILMGCIGPFGAIPRCIALSHATTNMFFNVGTIVPFSIAACLVIFFLTLKKKRIIDIVGWILTPFFLLSIGLIVIMGIIDRPAFLEPSSLSSFESVIYGLKEGYNTMDLLGAFFFGSVVIHALQSISKVDGELSQKQLVKNGFWSCLVGAILMVVVYVGMSTVSAFHAGELVGVKSDVLIGTIALQVLGPYAGITTCIAVIIATLTTAIALATVFADFISQDVCKGRLSYPVALSCTMAIAFCVSTLEFSGIVSMLAPIVQMMYPVLLILCLVNIGIKLWRYDPAQAPRLESTNSMKS